MSNYDNIDIYKIIEASLSVKELHEKLFWFIVFYKNTLL